MATKALWWESLATAKASSQKYHLNIHKPVVGGMVPGLEVGLGLSLGMLAGLNLISLQLAESYLCQRHSLTESRISWWIHASSSQSILLATSSADTHHDAGLWCPPRRNQVWWAPLQLIPPPFLVLLMVPAYPGGQHSCAYACQWQQHGGTSFGINTPSRADQMTAAAAPQGKPWHLITSQPPSQRCPSLQPVFLLRQF